MKIWGRVTKRIGISRREEPGREVEALLSTMSLIGRAPPKASAAEWRRMKQWEEKQARDEICSGA
jgi:hypothetical protein